MSHLRPNELALPEHLSNVHCYWTTVLTQGNADQGFRLMAEHVKDWVNENLKHEVLLSFDEEFNATMVFDNEAEMMLFALRWL